MKKSTKILALVLSLVMVLALMPMGAMAAVQYPTAWQVSKSKTATALDNNNETTVTLSLPSAEYKNSADVVFVLDKSTSGNIQAAKNAACNMVDDLATKTNVNVKVGVIVFNRDVTVNLGLTELTASSAQTIKDAIIAGASGGSNTQGGLLKADELLAADTEVQNANKYVVYVTDGIGYVWGSQGHPMSSAYLYGENGINGGCPSTSSFEVRIKAAKEADQTFTEPTFAEVYSDDAGESVAAQYDKPFATNFEASQCIPFAQTATVVSAVERAIYLSAHTYNDLASKYNCMSIWYTPYGLANPEYRLAADYMTWTGTVGKAFCLDNNTDSQLTAAFDTLENKILYTVNIGTVTDVIGSNFDLKSLDTMALTVGGKSLPASVDTAKNTVNFGTADNNGVYPYSVQYTSGDGENLVWTINVPVENANRVQLSYTLKLANKSTTAGTHGVLDLNGDGKADGTETEVVADNALYTNESAVLKYKDSNGSTGTPENFGKPSVSYYVAPSGGGVIINPTPSPKPTDIPDPEVPKAELPADLNSTDHIAYIIGKPSGNVDPNGQITRAEVATAFYRLLTAERRDAIFTSTSTFSDMTKGQWFNKAVASMANGKYIKGYTDGTFGGNRSITRAEFVAIAARFMDAKSGTVTFSDVSSTNWAYQYISTAVAYGWINGYPDGTFKPDQAISRAEAMKIINTMLARGVDAAGLISGIKAWPDNTNVNAWYYYEIIEATNNHLYEGSRPSEKWSSLQTNYVYDIVKYEHP